MKFPIFFYTFLWFPIAIVNLITAILPFAFLEFNDECKFLENTHNVSLQLSFKEFQRTFIVIFILQILHFSCRKLRGYRLLPKTADSDYIIAILIHVTNLCFSVVFFHMISNSNCQDVEARLQGFLRIISILGSPILIYGIYDEPDYNVIIAQPVEFDEFNPENGIELPIYNNDNEFSDIEV